MLVFIVVIDIVFKRQPMRDLHITQVTILILTAASSKTNTLVHQSDTHTHTHTNHVKKVISSATESNWSIKLEGDSLLPPLTHL